MASVRNCEKGGAIKMTILDSIVFWEIIITIEFGIGLILTIRSLNKSQKEKEINAINNNKGKIRRLS